MKVLRTKTKKSVWYTKLGRVTCPERSFIVELSEQEYTKLLSMLDIDTKKAI